MDLSCDVVLYEYCYSSFGHHVLSFAPMFVCFLSCIPLNLITVDTTVYDYLPQLNVLSARYLILSLDLKYKIIWSYQKLILVMLFCHLDPYMGINFKLFFFQLMLVSIQKDFNND